MFFLRSYINIIKLPGTYWRCKIDFYLNPESFIVLCFVLLLVIKYFDVRDLDEKYSLLH